MSKPIKWCLATGAITAVLPLSMLSATAASAQTIHSARPAASQGPSGILVQDGREWDCMTAVPNEPYIITNQCTGNPEQLWIDGTPGNITLASDGTCLTAEATGLVTTSACTPSNNDQNWQLVGQPGDHQIQNVGTGKCLDVNGIQAVYIATCNLDDRGQHWIRLSPS
jgi:hypothetical protein